MEQSVDDPLLVEDEGRVRTLTLNRPSALNALNAAVFDRLERALDEIDGDTGVRVVVIRGSGTRAFCAGADLEELAGVGAEGAAGPVAWAASVRAHRAALHPGNRCDPRPRARWWL